MSSPIVTSVELTSLRRIARGKVRDLYEVDASTLLFTTTDRISAYDVIMGNGVPLKGAILTQLTRWWLDLLVAKIPDLKTHFVSIETPAVLTPEETALVRGRSMQVRKLKVFPLEVIVRKSTTTDPDTDVHH